MCRLLTLFLFCCVFQGKAQRYDATIVVDDVPRRFIVVVPSGEVPDGGYPLVVMLHGTSGDGEKFFNISGWKELGEEKGIVTAFPSSLSWCVQDEEDPKPHNTTKWVNGDLLAKACPGQTFVDDVKFLSVLVDTIKRRLTIDNSMVFLSGFSNGGVMTSKMAVDAPDVFRAVAPAAGFITDFDSAIANKPTPTWFCVGTKDVKFTEPRGLTELPLNDSSYYWMRGTIVKFLAAYQLKEEYEKDSTDGMISWTFTTPLEGHPASFLRFTLVKDLTHAYANGVNHPLKYAPMFWKFFQAVALNTGIAEEDSKSTRNHMTVYPNPATSHLTVDIHDDGSDARHHELRIVDVFGRTVNVVEAQPGQNTIPLRDLPPGLYSAIYDTISRPFVIAH